MIIGIDVIGYSYPIAIRISNFGIDEIEEKKFLNFLKENYNETTKELFKNYNAV